MVDERQVDTFEKGAEALSCSANRRRSKNECEVDRTAYAGNAQSKPSIVKFIFRPKSKLPLGTIVVDQQYLPHLEHQCHL